MCIISPFICYPWYFVSTSLVRGDNYAMFEARFKEKFPTVLGKLRIQNYWTPIQYMNFAYFSQTARVPIIGAAAFLEQTVLSWFTNQVLRSQKQTQTSK